jgi:steroid 5-alpha reductase family enzyme
MMSRGVELPWTVFGRRLRPFSFAIMCTTFVVGVQYIGLHTGPGNAVADWFTGGFAFIACFLLFTGWAFKSDDIHDWGLLFAGGVWGSRAALYLLEEGPSSLAMYFSLGWFTGIMGAYALERYDHKWRWHLAHDDE